MMEGVVISYLESDFRLNKPSMSSRSCPTQKSISLFFDELFATSKKCWSIDAVAGFFAGVGDEFA